MSLLHCASNLLYSMFSKSIICYFILTLITVQLSAQYYYNDIILQQANANNHALLVLNNANIVTAKSYNEYNEIVERFSYKKELRKKGVEVYTSTEIPTGGISITWEFYDGNLLKKVIDSTEKIKTTTLFSYTQNNMPTTIQITYDDAAMDIHATEQHLWIYHENTPTTMYRIKDISDTMVVRFKVENSKVMEEIWLRNGREAERYYYYYNEQNQISDIVRFNVLAQRLLPDFTYDYNASGYLTLMRQMVTGGTNYNAWVYEYNDKGLKQTEKLFSKENNLLGTIIYTCQ